MQYCSVRRNKCHRDDQYGSLMDEYSNMKGTEGVNRRTSIKEETVSDRRSHSVRDTAERLDPAASQYLARLGISQSVDGTLEIQSMPIWFTDAELRRSLKRPRQLVSGDKRHDVVRRRNRLPSLSQRNNEARENGIRGNPRRYGSVVLDQDEVDGLTESTNTIQRNKLPSYNQRDKKARGSIFGIEANQPPARKTALQRKSSTYSVMEQLGPLTVDESGSGGGVKAVREKMKVFLRNQIIFGRELLESF